MIDGSCQKYGRTVVAFAQMLGDSVILAGSSAAALAYVIMLRAPPGEQVGWLWYLLATALAIVILVSSFARSGLYDPLGTAATAAVLAITARRIFEVLLALTGCLFLFKISDRFSRVWLVAWGSSSVIALGGFRLLARYAAGRLISNGKLAKNLAIVGANEAARRLAVRLTHDKRVGRRLVGVFDQDPTTACHIECTQEMAVLDTLLAEDKVDEVVVTIPTSESQRIAELMHRFHPYALSLSVVAPQGFEGFRVLDSRWYGETNTLLIAREPLDEVSSVAKWLEDKMLAALCLLAALPLMLLIALAIKLDSEGPVLFRQKRLGASDRPFDLLKFRSMRVDQSDPLGSRLTRLGDPRITRIGRILRSTSLDELPQLINVLRGEMSLVGPRPHALEACAGGVPYGKAVDGYRLRHRVKPGMTGWAQVNGWRGPTETVEQLRNRVVHDIYYIDNWSLGFDLRILVRTLAALLRPPATAY